MRMLSHLQTKDLIIFMRLKQQQQQRLLWALGNRKIVDDYLLVMTNFTMAKPFGNE